MDFTAVRWKAKQRFGAADHHGYDWTYVHIYICVSCTLFIIRGFLSKKTSSSTDDLCQPTQTLQLQEDTQQVQPVDPDIAREKYRLKNPLAELGTSQEEVVLPKSSKK